MLRIRKINAPLREGTRSLINSSATITRSDYAENSESRWLQIHGLPIAWSKYSVSHLLFITHSFRSLVSRTI